MAFFDRFKGKHDAARLDEGLEKTRSSLFSKIGRLVTGKDYVDAEILDELEEALITSDVGTKTTIHIIEKIEARVRRDKYVSTDELNSLIHAEISALMRDSDATRPADFDAPLPHRPHVILVVGVNGVGKTTSIGKMAYRFKQAGKTVLLGAADTFRAAAIDQLGIWSERADVPLIKQHPGADPAAVAYDTVAAGVARAVDVVIIDTAGRLHTKGGLMDELAKTKRAIARHVPDAPHEVLLVLDGSTGQNAVRQAEVFTESVDVSGLIVTKLDGSARGGVIVGISHTFDIPVKYIGVGEQMEDLQIFDRAQYAASLFGT